MIGSRGRVVKSVLVAMIMLLGLGLPGRGLAAAPQAASGGDSVSWSTCLGGSKSDEATAVTTDGAGNIYVTGWTTSSGWVSGGFDTHYNNAPIMYADGFVVKISPTGEHLWSTYLGGNSETKGLGIACDAGGNAYICGSTDCSGWVSGGYNTTFHGGLDGFAAKLSPAGQHLWSALIGGGGNDLAWGIAVDGAGNPCLVGETTSADWTPEAYYAPANYYRDAFVTRLTSNGAFLWLSFLGGPGGDDQGRDVAIDGTGDIYVTGFSSSAGWVAGGYRTAKTGGTEAFVARLTPLGKTLWSTYLGGGKYNYSSEYTYGRGIALDGQGGVCVTGLTSVAGWFAGAEDTTFHGYVDAFVARLSTAGEFLWSTGLGGSREDTGADITTDAAGTIYVTGSTYSAGWPRGGADITLNGSINAFIAALSPAGRCLWSSYLGAGATYGNGLAIDKTGNLAVAGETTTSTWVSGGYKPGLGGSMDGFAARIARVNQVASGSLCVTINPAGAAAAGARWRRAGTTAWLNSGTTETSVPTGFYSIEFKPAPYWVPPTSPNVTIRPGESAVASATYAPGGGLRVTLTPPEAVAEGAQWRRSGTTAWLDNGTSETSLPAGNYTVVFKPIADWATPAIQNVTVRAGQTTETTAAYFLPMSQLSWSTTTLGNTCNAVALDEAGNIYATGNASSVGVGWISGGYDTSYNGGSYDAFVMKLGADGQPLWSTYLGGSQSDLGYGIALDSQGNVCVTGYTSSSGWLTGGGDTALAGTQDAFVVKLSPMGAYLWGTFLGGAGQEYGYGIAADGTNNLYIAGSTTAADWISKGFNTTYGGGSRDAFVAKLSPAGDQLWSACLGGAMDDDGFAIAVDHAGNVCVAGSTNSPTGFGGGGGDATYKGGVDGFVAKLTGAGQFLWSSYQGSAYNADYCQGIAIDAADDILLTGYLTSGPYATAFVTKLSSASQSLWSRYLGSGDTKGMGIATDHDGNIFVSGETGTPGWVSGGYTTQLSSYVMYGYTYYVDDGFVAKLSPAGDPLWSTYLGLSSANIAGIGVNGQHEIAVAGRWNNQAQIAKLRDLIPNEPRGAVAVTLEPPEAVAAGAKWFHNGQSILRDSGTTATNIAAGSYLVSFKAGTGWTAPPPQRAVVQAAQTTTLTATFVRQTGSLIVTLDPPAAVAAGARWRRAGTTAWHDSGTTETGVPAGMCQIEFSDVAGWVKPIGEDVRVDDINSFHLPTQASFSYTVPTGSLRVLIYPREAAFTPACWRPAGTQTWYYSGQTTTNLPLGNMSVEFKDLAGWDTPPAQNVTIAYKQTAQTSGTYVRQTGAIFVAITPPEAVAAGMKWRRVGTTAWRNGNTTETGIPTGAYKVEFNRPIGWMPAAGPLDAPVSNQQTTKLSVNCLPTRSDPVWSTYLGGGGDDRGVAATLDAAGNIYVAGTTANSSYGWITGGPDLLPKGMQDIFVTKLAPDGRLLWSTYLGGGSHDTVSCITLDNAGNIFVGGGTWSMNWTSGGYDADYQGSSDGYVVKLSPSGQHLWSTYVGGANSDMVNGIAVDAAGNAFVTGYTASPFWINGSLNTVMIGSSDAFLLKLSPSGQRLWGTYVGGGGDDAGNGVALDGAGNIYLAGWTSFPGWVAGELNTRYNGMRDGFVAKFSPAGAPLWGLYLGSGFNDSASNIVADARGGLWVIGNMDGAPNVSYEGIHGYLARLTLAGQLLWLIRVGDDSGQYGQTARGLTVDGAGNAYVAGSTTQAGWVAGEISNKLNGTGSGSLPDGYLVKVSPASQTLWATYLGGSDWDWACGVVVDPSGANLAVTGYTASSGWVSGGYDTTYNGSIDAFVAKLHDNTWPAPAGSLQVTVTPSQAATAGAKWRRVGTTAWQASGATEANVPAGTWWVEFQPGRNWQAPAMAKVTISQGQLTQASAICTRNAVAGIAWTRY